MAEQAEGRFFPAEAANEPPPPPRRPRHGTCPSSSPESRFWRSFRNSQLASGMIHPVTHLEFSPASPYDLAASVSANVNLYGGSPDLSPKSFSPLQHFEDVAYSPSFRCDGALLAAGGQSGLVQIFDPNRARLPLRRLRAHSRAVRVVRYPRIADKVHLFSGGDDAVLNYWDAATETRLLSFPAAHKDYIRAGSASPVSADLIATGSYDHMVRLWDVRSSENSVLAVNHGDPVESVLFLPSGGLMATAGGNVVKLWDVISGGRMIHRLDCHNKTVTSVCLGAVGKGDEGEPRLLTASLDGYVKVFDYAAFRITHSTRFPSMLLSVAFSPAGNALVAGTSNGVIYIGKKKRKIEKTEETEVSGGKLDGYIIEREKPALRPSNFRYFQRGQSEKPSATDVVVRQTARVRLAEHDKLLKKFEHGKALLSSLDKKNPKAVMAVMQELVARRKLLACVRAMDPQGLELLLSFLHKNATMPRYARFLMGLTTRVLQMRAEDIHSSPALRTHARNIKRMVAEEIKVQHALQEIQGIVSPLLRIAGR
ncbi:unnamed protein product [Spirodela intermedia]|uniref:U3 small nucleolar RNA-associated protein 15 C-terminal domain-containing protein n=1 Tax=Spirodela intermedia TaxID=51605 RepID=A0A7I8LEI9_SPIIN|nr:unnamed protein product [Spirodela intermedia]